MKPKLCEEVALEQLDAFKEAWGYFDPKAVRSGGEESSMDPQAEDIIVAGIMAGAVEIIESGKVVKVNLSSPVDELSFIEFRNHIKVRDVRTDATKKGVKGEEDVILQACTGLSDYQLSELTSRDYATVGSVAAFISFT
jgi:hypothetical protein